MAGFSFVQMTGQRTSTTPWALNAGFAPSAGCEALLQQHHLGDNPVGYRALGQKEVKGPGGTGQSG